MTGRQRRDNRPTPDRTQEITFTPERDPLAPGLLQEIPPPRSVVILKASRIGDYINATPAVRALRKALPQAAFTMITLPALRDLAERSPHIDHYAEFPGYPGIAEQLFEPARALAFFREMQARRFDLAVQLQGSGVYANPFLLMLGARRAAGFIRENDPPGRLDAALPWPETGHEIRRSLALSEFLGAPADGLQTEFPLRQEDHEEAERLLNRVPPPWIGVHTAARDLTRRWPLERFAAAATLLQKRNGGTIILVGEPRDREQSGAALAESAQPFLNLAGCTTLPQTGAVLKRLSVFITNDTGPAHIAYAVNAPTVTIFGGGDPLRNGPLLPGPFRILAHEVPCRPCDTGTCPIDLLCLRQITVNQVVQAAEEVMRECAR
ncbi:MAG: glycosyltransferase family 9 protein [Chloroflexi bacterium]|nr:glycosyltransferase family 9 protein [Chloroflexota bacterium]